jgi:hypothetical protein
MTLSQTSGYGLTLNPVASSLHEASRLDQPPPCHRRAHRLQLVRTERQSDVVDRVAELGFHVDNPIQRADGPQRGGQHALALELAGQSDYTVGNVDIYQDGIGAKVTRQDVPADLRLDGGVRAEGFRLSRGWPSSGGPWPEARSKVPANGQAVIPGNGVLAGA